MLRAFIALVLLIGCGESRAKSTDTESPVGVGDGVMIFEPGPEFGKGFELARATVRLQPTKSPQPTKPGEEIRQVRMWDWEAPSGTAPTVKIKSISQIREETATDLLRVCVNEAGFESSNDCIAIWEVATNIRSRNCRRDLYPRITACDVDGETGSSILRRLQRVVLGDQPPESKRARWVSTLELDCQKPEGYPYGILWERRDGRMCRNAASYAKRLVRGQRLRSVTRPATAIAWGGRCETRFGACDDPIACRRGLARIPKTYTQNAFWCRVGSRNCSAEIDPVCKRLGISPRFD